jgi:enterochelin esterase-like enzyme
LLAVSLVAQDASKGKPEADPPVIGIGHKHTFPSRILGENVDLVVHLPGDYSSGEKRYPVLLFLGSDYRAKYALAAATLDCMTDGGQLPGIVLVGVDLPHGNFVQVPLENAGGTASADRQLAMLKEEIIPFVDRTFRTNGYRIVYGGSNSGVFAVYALLSGKLPCQAFLDNLVIARENGATVEPAVFVQDRHPIYGPDGVIK